MTLARSFIQVLIVAHYFTQRFAVPTSAVCLDAVQF
jgi:hypothetical protein